MKKLKYLVIVLALLPIKLNAQWAIMKSDADSLVQLGTYYIYNVKFDSAEAAFKKVIDKYPEHPAGYFLAAMVDWWKTKLLTNTDRYNKSFISKITKVVDISDEMLKDNSKDINALFFKAGALGYRGRFYAEQKSWLKAASDGSEAFNLLQECRKIAPHNHDIMLGTGIYNYFAKVIPEEYPITKPLLTFLPRGDKSLALYQLKAASKHARYADVEALVVLMQIYYTFEKDNYEAIKYADTLLNRYPDNPYFHRYLGRALVRSGKNTRFENVWREIVLKCMDDLPGYNIIMAREALYYVGLALYKKRDYEMSLKYFKKSDEASKIIDGKEDTESGFQVKTNIYIAKLYDKLGQKEMAKNYYKRLLKMKDYDSSHSQAEYYLKN